MTESNAGTRKVSGRFVSGCCEGERCFCGAPATHKVEETIFYDDPFPSRHPFTAYICDEHFGQIMGGSATALSTPALHVEREAIADRRDIVERLQDVSFADPEYAIYREAAGEITTLRAARFGCEPSTEMIDRGVAFALNVSLSDKYNWSQYVRDLYCHMVGALGSQATNSPGDAGASHNTGERNPSVMPDSSPGELRESGGAR